MSLEEAAPPVLSHEQYNSLLDAAETYREALVVRCCGDVGLRPGELTRLTLDSIDQVRVNPPQYLLRVPAADNGTGRTAYLPTRVERELRRYGRSNGVSSDELLFGVTPRRLQMLVSDVADRASELFDDPALSAVSTNDLRRYFAHTALAEQEINPRVVKRVGGWGSFEALEPYLAEPTDEEIVDAFAAAEGEGRNRQNRSRAGPSISDDSVVRSLLGASEQCALVRLDTDGYVERWNRSAESTFGYRAGEIVGTHVSAFYTDEAVEQGVPEQTLSTALETSGYEDDGWRVRKDGSQFRATEIITPVRDEERTLHGFAVLVWDISVYYDQLEETQSAHNDLERVYAVAERHRAVTDSLLEATSHEEIETETCATLTDGPAYSFAWIDRTTLSDHRQRWCASSGINSDQIDRLIPDEWHERRFEAANVDPGTAVNSPVDSDGDSESQTVTVTADRRVTFDNGSTFNGHIATVPLQYGDTVYGTLSVACERADAFGETERAWLKTTGRKIGYAIAAVRRRNLLLSDRVVELEFTCRDERSFFVNAANKLSCRFELDSLVPLSESTQLYYVRLEGASPADVFDLANEDPGIGDCRLIETYENACRVEFVVEGSSPTLTLTEYGVTVREATFENGQATITAECAADADLRTIVSGLRSAFPDSELIGKREAERTVQTAREFREGLEERLTDRQEAALRAAYFGGYYNWPRESTAEEIADAMGVSSPTLHSHLRKGQHELLRTFLDDPSTDG